MCYYKLSTPYPKIWNTKYFEIQNLGEVFYFKTFWIWDFKIKDTQAVKEKFHTNIPRHTKKTLKPEVLLVWSILDNEYPSIKE